jgi:hypothetical protein
MSEIRVTSRWRPRRNKAARAAPRERPTAARAIFGAKGMGANEDPTDSEDGCEAREDVRLWPDTRDAPPARAIATSSARVLASARLCRHLSITAMISGVSGPT